MPKNRITRKRNDTSSKERFVKKPKLSKKKATTGEYKGIVYDSLEELAFLQWASELKRAGYIRSITRSESFLLSESFTNDFVVQKGTSSKPSSQSLLQGHSYTPEFVIYWERKARDKNLLWTETQQSKFDGLFITLKDDPLATYIEIKPLWDQNNMERLFKINQKWMKQKFGIFVNLVKCPELFEETFTPAEYLTTKTGRVRQIKWKIKTLYEYLNQRKS